MLVKGSKAKQKEADFLCSSESQRGLRIFVSIVASRVQSKSYFKNLSFLEIYSHRFFVLSHKLSRALRKKDLGIMLSSRYCKRVVSKHRHVVERVWRDSMNEYMGQVPAKSSQTGEEWNQTVVLWHGQFISSDSRFFFTYSKIGINSTFQKKNFPLYIPRLSKSVAQKT
jgi:hypothetical protein